MITLSDFERYVPHEIRMRREDYYDSAAVTDLKENEPGEWIR